MRRRQIIADRSAQVKPSASIRFAIEIRREGELWRIDAFGHDVKSKTIPGVLWRLAKTIKDAET